MTENQLTLAAIFAVAALAAFVFMSGITFGDRCKAAGYSGAKHERCVIRAANGGPIYEENAQIEERQE